MRLNEVTLGNQIIISGLNNNQPLTLQSKDEKYGQYVDQNNNVYNVDLKIEVELV